MGNRRKSWSRPLMEGLQMTTFFSGIVLLVVVIYNLTHANNSVEYYYLVAPIFLVGAVITYQYSYRKFKHIVRTVTVRLKTKQQK